MHFDTTLIISDYGGYGLGKTCHFQFFEPQSSIYNGHGLLCRTISFRLAGESFFLFFIFISRCFFSCSFTFFCDFLTMTYQKIFSIFFVIFLGYVLIYIEYFHSAVATIFNSLLLCTYAFCSRCYGQVSQNFLGIFFDISKHDDLKNWFQNTFFCVLISKLFSSCSSNFPAILKAFYPIYDRSKFWVIHSTLICGSGIAERRNKRLKKIITSVGLKKWAIIWVSSQIALSYENVL